MILDIQLIQGHTEKKKTFDKRHHSNPLGESAAQFTVDLTPDQPAAIVSRGVGVHVRGFA